MHASSLPICSQTAAWSDNTTVKNQMLLPQKINCDQGNGSEQQKQSNVTCFPCDRPHNKSMENITIRIQSYNRWPYHIRATPVELSYAGLYYIGDRDRTKCFYCNGGLQNWEPNDDPWEEHAKWFPECPFLLNSKGPEYVHSVNIKFPKLTRPGIVQQQPYNILPHIVYNNTNCVISTSPTSSSFASGASNLPVISLEEIVRKAMKSDITSEIKQFGFSDEILRRTIERRLTSEDMFESMAEFVDAVQAVEQENNIKPPSGGASAACSNNLEQGNMQLGVNIPHHLVNDQVEIKIQELRDANRCKICFDRESSCVFGSCGHLCSCVECSSKVKACPICRQKIVNIIRIYKA